MTDLPAAWAAALAVRRARFDLADPEACLRLLHGEDAAMRCDRFGPVCWFYRYAPGPPDVGALAACEALTAAAGAQHWHVHAMGDRGRDPNTWQHWASAAAPAAWSAVEAGLRYGLRADSGQSPGLFLDQRRNRAWVREHTGGARLLNLFAYTGGFGLAALAGGATQVVQVDVSRAYLERAAANAAANGLNTSAVEPAPVDARLFLQGCQRRGRRFDAVVCDPPSFARCASRRRRRRSDGPFRVADDLAELVRACVEVVDPGGWVLVSSNYEGWSAADFETLIAAALSQDATTPVRLEAAPGPGPDFPAAGAAPRLHGCIVRVG